MSLDSLAIRLDDSAVSQFLKASGVIIPLAQSVHILAVAFVFSGAALLVARELGRWGGRASLADWARPLLAQQQAAVVVLVLTGTLLVVAEPTRELVNRAFQFKLALLVLTVPLSLLLARRQIANTGQDDGSHATRWLGLGVLGLWLAIIIVGRWIAYI